MVREEEEEEVFAYVIVVMSHVFNYFSSARHRATTNRETKKEEEVNLAIQSLSLSLGNFSSQRRGTKDCCSCCVTLYFRDTHKQQ